jgi:hypothetical protein
MKTCSSCTRKFHERALVGDKIPPHNVIAASKVTHNDPAKQCPGSGLPPRETAASRAAIAVGLEDKALDREAAAAPPPAPIEVETPEATPAAVPADGSGKVPAPS